MKIFLIFLFAISSVCFSQTNSVSGLIYKTDFTNLTGWSGDVSYFSSVNDPAFITFGKNPGVLLQSDNGRNDTFGTRQGSMFVENGVWYLFYDGGLFANGTTFGTISSSYPWYSNVAISNNRGLTWKKTLQFAGGKDSLGVNLTYGYAQGGVEKYGSTYYLYRVVFVNGTGSLYLGDVWTASSILGTWSFGHNIILESGTRAEKFVVPGKPIKVGSTYYEFEQSRSNTSGDQIGYRTSSNPSGPWVFNSAAILDGTSVIGSHTENPKPFFNSGIYALTINSQNVSGVTGPNAIVTSSSITDWSAKKIRYVQIICPLDCDSNELGVMSPVTGPENALQTGNNGFIPFTYDSDGTINSNGATDYAWGRKIRSGFLEPSPYTCQYTGSGASSRNIFKTLTNSDFTAEFALEHLSSVASSYMGFWYRNDGTTSNGYRLRINQLGTAITLEKVVSGTPTTIGTGSGTQVTALTTLARIKIVANGTSHKVYLNGELQISITDAAFSTGTSIGISGYGTVNSQMRLLTMRASDIISLAGLQPGSTVTLRSDGKFAIASTIVSSAGTCSFTHTHFPMETFEVNGVDYTPNGGIWGGDTWTFSGFSQVAKSTYLSVTN